MFSGFFARNIASCFIIHSLYVIDESENWILYHTKVSPEPSWEHAVHMQSITWNEGGSPHFGMPVQPGEELEKPSGECEE